MTDRKAGSRRDFLKLAAAGTPAVALTAAAGTPAEAAVEEAGEGLRKTDHVRKYLESARF